jgi:hypothetical protein
MPRGKPCKGRRGSYSFSAEKNIILSVAGHVSDAKITAIIQTLFNLICGETARTRL